MLLPARTGALARARTGRAPSLSREVWILLAVTVMAAVLRIVALGSQSYWLDESQAAHELSLSFGSMLHAWNTSEWNPPLYLILAWPWAQLAGTGEVALRSLSALAGVAVVPLLYLSGRELVSRRAGLVAAGFAAVNPLMIGYSQQAREYMLMTALCTASLLCFARALHAPTGRRLGWWAAISALALLTQYFAGFLIAAEGLALVARARSRASVVALVSQAVVLAPLIPHVSPQLSRPAQFIVSQPLSLRLQQVPVAFALDTLYKGPLVSDGLLAAAGLAAAVIALLVVGAGDRELRGAGIAAALAGVVVLVPLVLALAGRDDFIARGLMPAWPPLAVTIAAACTARRARLAGGALAAVLVALFVWGTVKIDRDAAYQNPDWRAVAAALGPARGTRVIVAYDGQFATGPLSYYLPRAPWAGPGSSAAAAYRPVTITEIDVVGEQYDQRPRTLPAGVSLISARAVAGYEVDRFALSAPRTTSPQAVLAGAGALLAPPVQGSAAMIQRAPP
jgi:4-amino-4-deoxy-L-arabinose transferase-like glycosyltransferase